MWRLGGTEGETRAANAFSCKGTVRDRAVPAFPIGAKASVRRSGKSGGGRRGDSGDNTAVATSTAGLCWCEVGGLRKSRAEGGRLLGAMRREIMQVVQQPSKTGRRMSRPNDGCFFRGE